MTFPRLMTATLVMSSALTLVACGRDAKDLNVAQQDATPPASDQTAPQQTSADVVALPEWHYDELYANGVSVSDLLDADVFGPTGEEIGQVENVLFGVDGNVLSVIAEVGGILDVGDTHVSVPWDQVSVDAKAGRITLPVTQETIEEHSLFRDPRLTASDASTNTQAVTGDNAGVANTGSRVWRAREFIGDYARLRNGEQFIEYGYVEDLIIQNGKLAAVVVAPDVTWGKRGLYAYPYYGYGYGWYPGLAYYDLPYTREDIGDMTPFESKRLASG